MKLFLLLLFQEIECPQAVQRAKRSVSEEEPNSICKYEVNTKVEGQTN